MAKPDQEDFIRECMGQFGPMPIDAFNRQWCVVCANRACSRSASNGMQFDQRVSSWQERLFTLVPRAEEGDPRYAPIASKAFLPATPALEISDRMAAPPRFEVISPEAANGTRGTGTDPGTGSGRIDILPAVPIAQEERATVPIQEPSVTTPIPDNTAFRQGTVLTPKTEETVLKPGGTFTFDSDE